MGSSLNPNDIKEGDDVYFECVIQSNPKPYKLTWFHDVSKNSHVCVCALLCDTFPLMNQRISYRVECKRERTRERDRENTQKKVLLSVAPSVSPDVLTPKK